jgi:hypothetical protein
MIKKETMSILFSLVLLYSFPLAALAGGAASVRLGPGSNVAAGVSATSRHGGSRASVFIRIGNRWVPATRGYYVSGPIFYGPYPSTTESQFSSSDPSGALYVNGYRVLPSGWLRVQVEPRDAEVLVNGFLVQTEKVSGISRSLGFLVGTHNVEVRKDGFQTYRTELPIQQAREVLLQVTLDR